ncbi:MAG: hypothetical protein ACPGJV_05195 [Bacteriovoracaceae bacterium]
MYLKLEKIWAQFQDFYFQVLSKLLKKDFDYQSNLLGYTDSWED